MNAKTAISILTIYLITYVVLFAAGFSVTMLACMFLASPFLLVWMVYSILKEDTFKYPELGDEEWGYLDKSKNELGMF